MVLQLNLLLFAMGRRVCMRLCLCLCFALLSGCGIQNPVIDTFLYALPGGRQFATLNQGYDYVVVEFEGQAAVMALGSRRIEGVTPFEDVFESWYNGQGEMLVLRNGRIYQAIGMAQELRSQEGKPPRWREVADSSFDVAWARQLDRMPGYRFAAQEQINTRKAPTPKGKFEGVGQDAQWFVDEVQSQTRQGRPWRFTQRFAVVNDRVVYSEQCVSESVCLKLRPINAVKAQSK